MHESSFPSESSCNSDDGIHLFVNPNNGLTLSTDRSQSSHLLDPILRLRTVISLGSFTNLLWTQDGNYILYPSNEIVIQMHIDTQQQLFFIGHTDKGSAIAFNGNSSLLATTQVGPNDILHLWKFEIRRCICVVRVSGTCNLHALDFDIRNLTDSPLTLVIVGHGSIELLCRTTTDASTTHIRFVPYDSTRCISIGLDNIRFWLINNGNDLKSMSISIVRIYRFTI
ncbi:unnamed protein product [Rotaria sp. Silwood2]|nr:unnamed protein product [Rotaria sp. Silwood2]CAF2867504.1 unnamed protein product [Rotaria sp. Silwood2]CAF3569123.1 unnamed protein product [Rotaria sp. Silwood2]CAF4099989.1 unnamed protein product [Rotaria sp. Silwood2]CAF4375479.1 unnamed protein product [Rotaria sp. Silwood2]